MYYWYDWWIKYIGNSVQKSSIDKVYSHQYFTLYGIRKDAISVYLLSIHGYFMAWHTNFNMKNFNISLKPCIHHSLGFC